MTTTQREFIQAEIGMLKYVLMALDGDIARQHGLYHSDEDMTAIKALIDCCVLSSRILTISEVEKILDVYTNALKALAKYGTSEMQQVGQKLVEERRLLASFLRFRQEI